MDGSQEETTLVFHPGQGNSRSHPGGSGGRGRHDSGPVSLAGTWQKAARHKIFASGTQNRALGQIMGPSAQVSL